VHLYLLCGMAFAGKTTLAVALSRHLRAEVVSLDEINAARGLYGGLGIPDAEWARSHEEALLRVGRALEAGRPVIVDDTNCFRLLRDGYRRIAALHGAGATVIYLDRPLELILDRLKKNERTRQRSPVTEPVLLDLARKFEIPEGDENVLVFPVDAAPEAWVAERFLIPGQEPEDRTARPKKG
jgi:predicted kinase